MSKTNCSKTLSIQSGKVSMSGAMVGQVGQSATANSRTVQKSMRQSVKSMDQSVSTMVITEPWPVPMLPSTTIHTIIVPRLPSSCLTWLVSTVLRPSLMKQLISMTVLPTLEALVVVKEQTLKLMPKGCCNHQLLRAIKVNTGPWDLTWPLKEKMTVISGTTLIQTSWSRVKPSIVTWKATTIPLCFLIRWKGKQSSVKASKSSITHGSRR